MVRVGPWTIENLEREEQGSHCERCSKAIKWIYVCRVDADAPRLVDLGGKAVWRIGSMCGPTLLLVSDQVWTENTTERLSAIKLIHRANRVLKLAHERGDDDWALSLIPERAQALAEAPLPKNLRYWLSSHVGRLERNYKTDAKKLDDDD